MNLQIPKHLETKAIHALQEAGLPIKIINDKREYDVDKIIDNINQGVLNGLTKSLNIRGV